MLQQVRGGPRLHRRPALQALIDGEGGTGDRHGRWGREGPIVASTWAGGWKEGLPFHPSADARWRLLARETLMMLKQPNVASSSLERMGRWVPVCIYNVVSLARG